jgi:hypothetical protein
VALLVVDSVLNGCSKYATAFNLTDRVSGCIHYTQIERVKVEVYLDAIDRLAASQDAYVHSKEVIPLDRRGRGLQVDVHRLCGLQSAATA